MVGAALTSGARSGRGATGCGREGRRMGKGRSGRGDGALSVTAKGQSRGGAQKSGMVGKWRLIGHASGILAVEREGSSRRGAGVGVGKGTGGGTKLRFAAGREAECNGPRLYVATEGSDTGQAGARRRGGGGGGVMEGELVGESGGEHGGEGGGEGKGREEGGRAASATRLEAGG